MKRFISLILIVAILFTLSLVGCKSQAERELEKANKAVEALEDASRQAQNDYDDLLSDIENYERAIGQITSAD